MLARSKAAATIAVKDTAVARKFYEGKLGLKPAPTSEEGVLAFQSGDSTLIVYPSQYAGTNKATAATWFVEGDLAKEVQDLKAKGVAFEHYDFPGTTRKGDLHVMGDTQAAWFKDPDGNILALVNSPR